jgi:hypothetical protein
MKREDVAGTVECSAWQRFYLLNNDPRHRWKVAARGPKILFA